MENSLSRFHFCNPLCKFVTQFSGEWRKNELLASAIPASAVASLQQHKTYVMILFNLGKLIKTAFVAYHVGLDL